MQTTNSDCAHDIASTLWEALTSRKTCEPPRLAAARCGWETSEANAYLVQREVAARRVAKGDTIVGRKVGLTTKSVRLQIGVDQPDYGSLWSSTYYGDGEAVRFADYIWPKLEADVALVLGKDILQSNPTIADIITATEYVLPALEIVDCRINNWDIKLFDLISDNASAAGFVLGGEPKLLHQLSLRSARMSMTSENKVVASGSGQDCMGHPLNAAVWLARQAALLGDPLRAGEIVMTGALGSMVNITGGQRYEATIDGLGSVSVEFV